MPGSTSATRWRRSSVVGVVAMRARRAAGRFGLTENAFLMFFFAAFALVVALAFAWYARRYPIAGSRSNRGELTRTHAKFRGER